MTYTVTFTSVSAASAYRIDFCTESTDPTEACTPPAGFDASAAASGSLTVAGDTGSVIVTDTIGATSVIETPIEGINNPTVTGPVYARIATYSSAGNASTETSPIDRGGVAISITNTIGVSGAVLETMTFCVASEAITADCDNAEDNLPTLKLGETVGTAVALQPGIVSTGKLYTQISTNASTGAVVNLKSATDCGGLKRVGAAICDIAPTLVADITSQSPVAAFGVKTATATNTAGAPAPGGVLVPVGNYNNTTYAFNYAANNLSGVTSPMGDPFLNTNSLPANNKNMELTFGATVTNATPAGNYSTSLSMIATGKF